MKMPSVINRLFGRRSETRMFSGAAQDRFTPDLINKVIKTNDDIRRHADILRFRSREMAKNNGDYRKFLRMCERNIIGPRGIRMRMTAHLANGKIDHAANTLLEERWRDFCRNGNCTANRRKSMRDLQKLIVRCWRIDGEVFLRRLPNFRNRHRYAFQLLDPAACPLDLNFITADGRRVVMGIELDEWNAPLAYYFHARSRSDDGMGQYYDPIYCPAETVGGDAYVRLPASEINHLYDEEFVEQLRGFPFGQAAMQEINLLGGYFYSELVAADAASRKFGKLINHSIGNNYGGRDGKTAERPQTISTEVGTVDVLFGDWKFEMYDPQHPVGNFPPFVKALNRKIANGLDVAYNGFANDLESVNFSSMRSGLLDERDAWMDQQQTIIDNVLAVEFERWLEIQLLMPDFRYGPAAFERLNKADWLPRRWQWVDPSKDAQANLLQLAMGATTPQDIAANLGNDFEDNVEKIKEAVQQFAPVREYVGLAQQMQQTFSTEQESGSSMKPEGEADDRPE